MLIVESIRAGGRNHRQDAKGENRKSSVRSGVVKYVRSALAWESCFKWDTLLYKEFVQHNLYCCVCVEHKAEMLQFALEHKNNEQRVACARKVCNATNDPVPFLFDQAAAIAIRIDATLYI